MTILKIYTRTADAFYWLRSAVIALANETRSEFKQVAPDTNIPQALQQIAGK
jgi:hypothetical protein